MFKVLIALICIGVGGTLGYMAMTKDNFCLFCDSKTDASSQLNPLQMKLIEDLNLATKDKELPPGWDQISEVRYMYHSKKVQQILSNNPIVAINKKGTKKLLVEFFDEPGANDIVMVRYNIVDIASQNTIGEMNRRLKFQAPPPPVEAVQKTGK